ncbi:hypothetical protein GJW-30_1_04030 [Variibacter gotjawalensis]|uniref:Uncharacterized protein n=1 Tax=Variibacter gotjawalensis TaxID=1333996 RepID=A0A0S3PZW7_9BRAD|nr:hypothetical protein [Variibacter gotjawalensis]NIK47313.1 hypothetical protein [Variibacter gotjawalensis]RZS49211.1 hypothetical protein EV661_1637 [Variibacter gotjawalensis]BAT61473.1 hypothetical protein GJW-30_1_04030 [Variibacter gotjawalensis]
MITFKQNIRDQAHVGSDGAIAAMIGASIAGDGASGTGSAETANQRRSISRWMAALLLIAPLGLSAGLLYQHIGAMPDQGAELPAECTRNDDDAVERLVALVRGKSDADLRQTADAIFRIRRARRNCHAGFISLAESDYRALRKLELKP